MTPGRRYFIHLCEKNESIKADQRRAIDWLTGGIITQLTQVAAWAMVLPKVYAA
jgi:hypothetical protein